MDAIQRFAKPSLRRPRAVLAFKGWNDAGGAASGAAGYLLSHFDVDEPIAAIEPEDFVDFQQFRPTVEVEHGTVRALRWPATLAYAVPVPEADRDLVVVIGDEPSLRWKTFARTVHHLLCEFDVDEAILLGAFLGQVPHTLPPPIVAVGPDPLVLIEHGLEGTDYQGQTGIVGVLQEAAKEVGISAVSLWAAVPHYLSVNTYPKAMMALVDRVGALLGVPIDTAELRSLVLEFDEQVDEAMRSSDDLAGYVHDLEDDGDGADADLTDDLVNEIEDFLRGQG